MKLHIQNTGAIVRWYDDEQGENPYEERKPFKTVCNLSFMGDTKVFCYGANGTLDRKMMRALAHALLEKGFREIIFEHKGEWITMDLKRYAPSALGADVL